MIRRAAFTLIELLIVAAIFVMLFGMVLAISRPSNAGQVRQAAQSIAGVLVQAQSRALGNPSGAGVILDSAGSFLPGTAVTSIAAADMLPLIEGLVLPHPAPFVIDERDLAGPVVGSVVGIPPRFFLPKTTTTSATAVIALSRTTTTVTILPLNAGPDEAQGGYKALICESGVSEMLPRSAWFSFGFLAGISDTNFTASIGFRAPDGQSLQDTIWPWPLVHPTRNVTSGTLGVLIARYPNQGDKLLTLPKNTAIDLRYSGTGDDPAATWGGLAGKGAIALTFDAVGGLDAVMQQVLTPAAERTVQPLHPSSPVYLLVARGDDVVADKALASETALWVAVHPQTGRVSVASNVVQTAKDATAVRAARAKARELVAIGK